MIRSVAVMVFDNNAQDVLFGFTQYNLYRSTPSPVFRPNLGKLSDL